MIIYCTCGDHVYEYDHAVQLFLTCAFCDMHVSLNEVHVMDMCCTCECHMYKHDFINLCKFHMLFFLLPCSWVNRLLGVHVIINHDNIKIIMITHITFNNYDQSKVRDIIIQVAWVAAVFTSSCFGPFCPFNMKKW